MMRFLISIVAIAALPVQAAAQTGSVPAADTLPGEVQKIYDGLKADCKAAGGKFIGDRGSFASEIEVTNDGRPDWVIEYAATRCTSFGHSAHCGTAGCSISILGSGRNGFTSIFNSNVRGWEVVEVAPRRKGLLMEVHGTACGGVGAERCRQTIAWNGRKWDLINSRRGTTDAEESAQEVEAAAYVESPGHVAKWLSVGKGKDAVAAVTGHPSFAAIGLRCNPNGGLFMSVVPVADFGLPPAGRDLMLSFTGSAVELEWTQSLQPEAGKRDYSEALPDVLRNMLAGRDDSLGLLASTDGGDEWQELEFLSLAGSSAAIRTLETQCGGVAGTTSTSTDKVSAAALGPLGIAAGYYVDEGTACTDPSDAFYYDGKRAGMIFAEGGIAPSLIGKVKKEGGEYFLPNEAILVKVLGPTRIQLTIQDIGPPMRLCPSAHIPQSIRRLVR